MHADAREPHRLVAADRSLVGGRGVDRQAVVAAALDQVADEQADRLPAESPPLPLPRRGRGRCPRCGTAGSVTSSYWMRPRRSVHLDREQLAVLAGLEVVRLRLAPPAPHARLGADGGERAQVGRLEPAQAHPLPPGAPDRRYTVRRAVGQVERGADDRLACRCRSARRDPGRRPTGRSRARRGSRSACSGRPRGTRACADGRRARLTIGARRVGGKSASRIASSPAMQPLARLQRAEDEVGGREADDVHGETAGRRARRRPRARPAARRPCRRGRRPAARSASRRT